MSPVRILLVEDNSTDAELIREALKELSVPYTLDIATDGAEALQKLWDNTTQPDLILLDLNLPKVSGVEVLQEIKGDPSLRIIPTLILTNSRSDEDVLQSYGNYCNAYIRKPIEFEDLVAAVKAIEKFWFELATLPVNVALGQSSTIPPPSDPE